MAAGPGCARQTGKRLSLFWEEFFSEALVYRAGAARKVGVVGSACSSRASSDAQGALLAALGATITCWGDTQSKAVHRLANTSRCHRLIVCLTGTANVI